MAGLAARRRALPGRDASPSNQSPAVETPGFGGPCDGPIVTVAGKINV